MKFPQLKYLLLVWALPHMAVRSNVFHIFQTSCRIRPDDLLREILTDVCCSHISMPLCGNCSGMHSPLEADAEHATQTISPSSSVECYIGPSMGEGRVASTPPSMMTSLEWLGPSSDPGQTPDVVVGRHRLARLRHMLAELICWFDIENCSSTALPHSH